MIRKGAVAVMWQVLISVIEPDSLAQLRHSPGSGWMGGEVAMDQSTTALLNDPESIEQAEYASAGEHQIAAR